MLQFTSKIWVLVGTRPEAIKQIPVYQACIERFGRGSVALIGTGQHRELLEQALADFGATLDANLEVMKPGQSLGETSAAILSQMTALLAEHRPGWLIVQGDTASAAMAAWAAFLLRIPVAHNEAGLRSYDLANPFPEEANRKLISAVATLHLAPTELARGALLREGVDAARIHVTGNPGIDALRAALAKPAPARIAELDLRIAPRGLKPVLLTAHRRENEGQAVERWFEALARFIEERRDLYLVYPAHPNNLARSAAERHLASLPRAEIVPPLGYAETCHLVRRSRLVVTDSGGIQEEAATLGIPVVVCRERTERMEAVQQGIARLAGTEIAQVLEAMDWAYRHPCREPRWNGIFGDGWSGRRIAALLDAVG